MEGAHCRFIKEVAREVPGDWGIKVQKIEVFQAFGIKKVINRDPAAS